MTAPGQVVFERPKEQLKVKTPKPCKTEYVCRHMPNSSLFVFSLEQNVMQNITQSQNTLELEMLIHNDQTVDARLPNGIKDGV